MKYFQKFSSFVATIFCSVGMVDGQYCLVQVSFLNMERETSIVYANSVKIDIFIAFVAVGILFFNSSRLSQILKFSKA